MQQVPGQYNISLWFGYLFTLLVALAREDHAAADAAAALLERALPLSTLYQPLRRSLAAAHFADDPTRFDLDGLARRPHLCVLVLLYFAERNLPTPGWLIQAVREYGAAVGAALADIAEALTSSDNVLLAEAIDTAEARHLIPHAARMRIVLAQRTGDRAPLERARPVLEQLGDRQFLRRLEEVEASLPAAPPAALSPAATRRTRAAKRPR
jgi:hypothetical protein